MELHAPRRQHGASSRRNLQPRGAHKLNCMRREGSMGHQAKGLWLSLNIHGASETLQANIKRKSNEAGSVALLKKEPHAGDCSLRHDAIGQHKFSGCGQGHASQNKRRLPTARICEPNQCVAAVTTLKASIEWSAARRAPT